MLPSARDLGSTVQLSDVSRAAYVDALKVFSWAAGESQASGYAETLADGWLFKVETHGTPGCVPVPRDGMREIQSARTKHSSWVDGVLQQSWHVAKPNAFLCPATPG